ncbi:MAG TPA: hypothetical protein VJ967_01065 [Clostridia bacterium]|nr:hypothetical protein [Clostridia bacterium]
MSIKDWQNQKYNEAFHDALHQIQHLREIDPNFTIDSLKQLLETAYVHEGNNWTGRGAVGDVEHEARIAAYQQILTKWETEQEPNSPSS